MPPQMDDDSLQEQEEFLLEKFQCPKCGSMDVRRASREGFLVALLSSVGRWPFRCRSCRSRFFRASPPPPEL